MSLAFINTLSAQFSQFFPFVGITLGVAVIFAVAALFVVRWSHWDSPLFPLIAAFFLLKKRESLVLATLMMRFTLVVSSVLFPAGFGTAHLVLMLIIFGMMLVTLPRIRVFLFELSNTAVLAGSLFVFSLLSDYGVKTNSSGEFGVGTSLFAVVIVLYAFYVSLGSLRRLFDKARNQVKVKSFPRFLARVRQGAALKRIKNSDISHELTVQENSKTKPGRGKRVCKTHSG